MSIEVVLEPLSLSIRSLLLLLQLDSRSKWNIPSITMCCCLGLATRFTKLSLEEEEMLVVVVVVVVGELVDEDVEAAEEDGEPEKEELVPQSI